MKYINFYKFDDYINPYKYNLKRICDEYINSERFAFRYESFLASACNNVTGFREAYLDKILNCDFTIPEELRSFFKRIANS